MSPDLRELSVPIAGIGLTLLTIGILGRENWDPFPDHNFWKTSPWFYFIRAGWIFVVLAILCAVDVAIARGRRKRAEAAGVAPSGRQGGLLRFIQVIGTQTLVIYVAHLFLIYGVGPMPGVKRLFHRNLGFGGSVGVVLGFFVAMAALAWAWSWTKKNHLQTFDRVRYAITALILVAFLVR